MKKFLDKKYFKELKVLIILESILILLGYALINTQHLHPHYFNPFAFAITLFVWVLSSIIEPDKYFNMATLITGGLFEYGCFWFMFEIYMKC